MFEWAEANGCRHRLLGRHFGEDIPTLRRELRRLRPGRAGAGLHPAASVRRTRHPDARDSPAFG